MRHYAVAGATREARRDLLNEYLQHQAALAGVAPASADAARAFLAASSSPLANAAWRYDAAFGWTDVPVELMQDYVSAQTYALRSAGNGRFGYAWSPKNLAGIPDANFNAQTDALLVRLAAAIADSGDTPEAGLRRCLVHRQPRRRHCHDRLAHVRRVEAVPARVHLSRANRRAGCSVDAADGRAADEHRHPVHGRRAGDGRALVLLADGRARDEPRRPLDGDAHDADRLGRELDELLLSATPVTAQPRSRPRPQARRRRRSRSPSAPHLPLPRLPYPRAAAVAGRRRISSSRRPRHLLRRPSATRSRTCVNVRNLGGPASRALLAVQLPSQVAYAGSQSDRGPGCTGATTLACDLDFLAGDLVATVRISAVVRAARDAGASTPSPPRSRATRSRRTTRPASSPSSSRRATSEHPRRSARALRAVGTPARATRARGAATLSVRFSVAGAARLEARADAAALDAPAHAARGHVARWSPGDEGAVRSPRPRSPAPHVPVQGTDRRDQADPRPHYLVRLTATDADGRRRALTIRVSA